ncbi:hypothetical protein DFH09DRAFT_1098245 [Mycena vulgaris]|nr:hypothetical protein DFH09DRAFT_1098245 [Mycena vulgaris]
MNIVRIDVAIKKRALQKNSTILENFKGAKDGNGRLHLLGPISEGGRALAHIGITTMSRYNTDFPFPAAFPPQAMTNIQTGKYAHVTFFNGGVEKQFALEEYFMIPSPKVVTYYLKPDMSVQAVTDKVAEVVASKEYDFVMCNFPLTTTYGRRGTR